jgi:hypothetical protein
MKKHAMDAVSLAFGVVFLGFVAWWQLARWVTLDPPRLGWFVAGGLILLGTAGVVATLRSDRRRLGRAQPPEHSTQ